MQLTSTAELYDPIARKWSVTGSLPTSLNLHTATLLPDGRVLVAGGSSSFGTPPLSTALTYDPAAGSWTATGNLAIARKSHVAVLLPNGKVLVTGGADTLGSPIPSSELYDPVTGVWTPTGSLTTARYSHSATLLPSGKVLVTGGQALNSAGLASSELYDPATGLWTATGSLNTARDNHTATLLPNGKVLVAGGWDSASTVLGTTTASAELYDPATGLWTVTGSLTTSRYQHTATVLLNGKVLVTGGDSMLAGQLVGLASTELYDPANGSWTTSTNLASVRFAHTANLLSDGKVLLTGGVNYPVAVATSELY
jgi:N-acetylneuraminic acid mutarotase